MRTEPKFRARRLDTSCESVIHPGYEGGGFSTRRGIDGYNKIHEMDFPRFIASRGLEDSTCLDIGCGNGVFLQELSARFPNLNVLGVDNKRYRTNVPLVLNDARCMVDILSGVVDWLVSSALTQWIEEDIGRFYAEAYRVLKDNGKGFIFPCNPEHVPKNVLKDSFLRTLKKGSIEVDQLVIWKRSAC